MAWHRFAAALLRQDDPEHRKVLYWDDGPLHAGELLLWLDEGGDVARFLLSHRPFRGPREHCVEWQRGGAPRFGEVDDGEAAGRGKMTPIVHFGRADPAALAGLQAYFAANAAALEPAQGTTIADVLGPGVVPPPDAPRRRRAGHPPCRERQGRGHGRRDGGHPQGRGAATVSPVDGLRRQSPQRNAAFYACHCRNRAAARGERAPVRGS
jgi:hypothetical protein